jgi:PAS domain-containing protein
LIVSNIKDYAIIGLDPEGRVTSWNGGAQRIKGCRTEEILSKHLSVFYLPEDIAIGKPTNELDVAREQGHFEDNDWRVRRMVGARKIHRSGSAARALLAYLE